ncbi:MAG TPA: LamG-like jellyroll fold domain-containing protein [Polyangiaceae bacterium]|nr:LamG-like jellyroll fold domain-containing protein [Polyangiaceae bacterium]
MKLFALGGSICLVLACSSTSDDDAGPGAQGGGAGQAGHGTAGAGGHAGSAGAPTTGGTAGAGRAGQGGGAGGAAAAGVSGAMGASAGAGNAAGSVAGGAAGKGGTSGGAGRGGGGIGPGGSGEDGGMVGEGGGVNGASTYDEAVLADGPVAYLLMNHADGAEPDVTGHGRDGTHQGGAATLVSLPNGDQASDLDGEQEYVTIASHASLSVPTTGSLTWEVWIRPDELEFPNDSNGYVNFMGKCQSSKQNCEWQSRMYKTTNSEDRCNRISAYIFNKTGGLGSAADWQPECGLIEAGSWYHVVGEYTLDTTPDDCQDADTYPGSIEIWVNGVKWDHDSHGQTGCMSQYEVLPSAENSPVNIGTNAKDGWFAGAIGKVAFYDKLLPESAIHHHYQVMTGKTPTGSCASECSF